MKDKILTWGPLYLMSANELKLLKAYFEKMLDNGFIQASSLSAAFLILFAKNPDKSL